MINTPRCMHCNGWERVPGLTICKTCVTKIPTDILNKKLETNDRFREWWNNDRLKTNISFLNFDTKLGDLVEQILAVLKQAKIPMDADQIIEAVKGQNSDQVWNNATPFYRALEAIRTENLAEFDKPVWCRGRFFYWDKSVDPPTQSSLVECLKNKVLFQSILSVIEEASHPLTLAQIIDRCHARLDRQYSANTFRQYLQIIRREDLAEFAEIQDGRKGKPSYMYWSVQRQRRTAKSS